MELAAHWHRCQNLPKKRVNTSLLYRERDGPVKDGLANWRTRSGTRETGTSTDICSRACKKNYHPTTHHLTTEVELIVICSGFFFVSKLIISRIVL